MSINKQFWWGGGVGVLITSSIFLYGSRVVPKSCSQPFDIDGVSIEVNQLRLEHGREQLSNYPDLARYAQLRANEIAETGNFDHQTKYGSFSEWANANSISRTVPYESIGEDLDSSRDSSCDVVDDFKGSPTHLDSLINEKYTGIGVGIRDGYTVVILGNPL